MRHRLLVASLTLVGVMAVVFVGLLAYGWADARSARTDLADRLRIVEAKPDLTGRVIALELVEPPAKYNDGELRALVSEEVTNLQDQITGLHASVQRARTLPQRDEWIVLGIDDDPYFPGNTYAGRIRTVTYRAPRGGSETWTHYALAIDQVPAEHRDLVDASNISGEICFNRARVGAELPDCMR